MILLQGRNTRTLASTGKNIQIFYEIFLIKSDTFYFIWRQQIPALQIKFCFFLINFTLKIMVYQPSKFASNFCCIFFYLAFATITIEQTTNPSTCSPSCSGGEICTLQNNVYSCVGTCGDGIVARNQVCDDGDTDNTNGCSNSCQLNDYWICLKKLDANNLNRSDCYYNQIPKCKKYTATNDNQIKCMSCVKGEELSADGLKCMIKMPGCSALSQAQSNSTTPTCSSCENGYNITDKKNMCILKIHGCSVLDQTRSSFVAPLCSTCMPQYLLTAKRDKCILKMGGCLVYDQILSVSGKSICTTCATNTYLVATKDKCLFKILNCTKYDQIKSNSTKSFCLQCDTGLIPNINKDKCIKNAQWCAYYNTTLSTSTGSGCTACSQNQLRDLTKDNYILKIPGCDIYNEQASSSFKSICQLCQTGYVRSFTKQKCVKPIQNCVVYEDINSNLIKSFCLMCKDGYVPSALKDSCVAIPLTNCLHIQSINSTTQICLLCQPNYFSTFNKKACILSSNFGCAFFDSQGNCTDVKIQQQYKVNPLTKKASILQNRGCYNFTPNSINCTRCLPGYTLNSTVYPSVCNSNFFYYQQINSDFGLVRMTPITQRITGTGYFVMRSHIFNISLLQRNLLVILVQKQSIISVCGGAFRYVFTYNYTNNSISTQFFQDLNQCHRRILISKPDPRFNDTNNCPPQYINTLIYAGNDYNVCQPIFKYQLETFTPLGNVRIFNMKTNQTVGLDYKWRALRLEQVNLIKFYLDSIARFKTCVVFNGGTMYGIDQGYRLNTTIDPTCTDRIYIIKLKDTEISNCKKYTSTISPFLCAQCDIGYTLSTDKTNCNHSSGKKCWIYDSVGMKCLVQNIY